MAEASLARINSVRRAIIICALGYCIDIFDVQLFAVLRIPSLTEIGVAADKLTLIGGYILNAQMLGMVMGAFLWGFLGDRFGRLKALYGSILVYSLGAMACSLVHDPVTYGILRFVSGFGLAGETGAAITLVAELMPAKNRTWGVTIIAGFGLLGPAFAIMVSWFLGWRETYVVAGVLGLLLLVLRLKLVEPELFRKMAANETMRGSLRLIARPKQLLIYVCCILTSLPISYTWFVLNFYSMEFSRSLLAEGEVFNQKLCFLLFYIATSCGDLLAGTVSQLWGSRRKTILVFLLLGVAVTTYFLLIAPVTKMTAPVLYLTYFALGIMGGGCLVLIFTTAAEHFGTNIRATTAITINNIQRGCSIFMIFAFQALERVTNATNAAALIAVVLYAGAFLALRQLRETHGLDLDYVERLERPAKA